MKLYDVNGAAEYLDVSPQRVRQFCGAGRLGQKVGHQWIITEAELAEFAQKPRLPGVPQMSPSPR